MPGAGTQNSEDVMPTGSVSAEKAATCHQLLLQEGAAPARVKQPVWGAATGWETDGTPMQEKGHEPLCYLPQGHFHVK